MGTSKPYWDKLAEYLAILDCVGSNGLLARGSLKRSTRSLDAHSKSDLEKCYFSPRLSLERMRIAELVKPNETIVNMFAGVGSFSILIACQSKVRKVFSIDVDPVAVKLMHENARLNRVESKLVPILGDAKDIARKRLRNIADRVIMPLPQKAFAYLEYALIALKSSGGCIHYYDFEHASKTEDPVKKVQTKVEEKLQKFDVSFTV